MTTDPTATRQRYDQLAALYRLASVSTEGRDLAGVVEEIKKVVAEVVGCDRVAVFLYDENANALRLYVPQNEDPLLVPLDEPSIIRRVFQLRQAEVVNDVLGDPDANPHITGRFLSRQMVAAPLLSGGECLGVVGAINATRGAFVENDVSLLTLLADRAALAVQNTQLMARLERQVQELEGLHRLSRLLTSAEMLDWIIGESTQIVSELLAAQKTAILLYEADSNMLVARRPVVGLDERQVEQLRIPLEEPSLAGTVYRTNTPLSSNAAKTDAWIHPRFRELLDMDNVLAVPLSSGPRPIGVLKAVNAKKGYFDDEDMRFLSLLGSRVASVIEAARAREKERGLVQKLREADRTKSEFVSMLAHELKGPMTTILGFGDTLEKQWESVPEEKKRQIVGIMSKETARLSRLVNDLLDVSRMEAGTLRYELAPMSLVEVVDQILMVHSSLSASHFVHSEIPADLPPVLGDRDRIRQVLLNLLTNATRYSPDGTKITVGARSRDDGFIEVWVGDEGIGIPTDDRERIFSKFAMLPKPDWAKKGTGLGLYITKGIVEAHRGHIWVESDVGRGSTFFFTLQAAPDSQAVA